MIYVLILYYTLHQLDFMSLIIAWFPKYYTLNYLLNTSFLAAKVIGIFLLNITCL
jgi:hypothetical protein